jgi:hypothetical protein
MNYTFTLTEQEASLILNALQEIPAKYCNPLTKKLQDQAREQVAAAESLAKSTAAQAEQEE